MLNHLDSDINIDWATLKVHKESGFYIVVECKENNQLPPYKLVINPILLKNRNTIHNYFESVPEIFQKFRKCQSKVNGGPMELEHWSKIHGFEVDNFVEMMEELYEYTLEHNPETLI